MSTSITLRIVVQRPHPEVELRLQCGRAELVPALARSADAATFEFSLEADVTADGVVRLRGPAAQGPPAARFVYINAGTYAGQPLSPWGRRAKVPLSGVDASLVRECRARPGAVIVGTIDGRGKDGGPAAATVPLLGDGWRLDAPSE
jgi:hypothetical protein